MCLLCLYVFRYFSCCYVFYLYLSCFYFVSVCLCIGVLVCSCFLLISVYVLCIRVFDRNIMRRKCSYEYVK